MRLRKEVYLVLAVIAILVLFFLFRPGRGPVVMETNLDGIELTNTGTDRSIVFDETTRISLPNPPGIFLIANGNIVKDSDVRAIDGSSMIPMEILRDIVDGQIETSETDGDEFTIKTEKTKVVFRLNQENVEVNDKASFIDVAPRREGRKTYVPLKSMMGFFDFKVEYTDGTNVTKTMYPLLPGYQQIFVSKYPEKLEPLKEEEALSILQEQLKKAYKVLYQEKFKELKEEDQKKSNLTEQEQWRLAIGGNIKMVGENDRYHIFKIKDQYLVDKYTEAIYVFKSGDIYKFKLFDPKDPKALK
ncbi:MAG: stalk domain-containing protein [Tissierellia bacterium]|nr:stalk domain-containing protein [Tissierellia bacterium]